MATQAATRRTCDTRRYQAGGTSSSSSTTGRRVAAHMIRACAITMIRRAHSGHRFVTVSRRRSWSSYGLIYIIYNTDDNRHSSTLVRAVHNVTPHCCPLLTAILIPVNNRPRHLPSASGKSRGCGARWIFEWINRSEFFFTFSIK